MSQEIICDTLPVTVSRIAVTASTASESTRPVSAGQRLVHRRQHQFFHQFQIAAVLGHGDQCQRPGPVLWGRELASASVFDQDVLTRNRC